MVISLHVVADSGHIQTLMKGGIDPGHVKRALHRMIPFLAVRFRSAPAA